MIHLVEAFLTHFTYLALVLVLCAAGMGVPIPEDVPLIFSGYLCKAVDANHNGIIDSEEYRITPRLEIMIIAGLVGVLVGDSIVFMIGRRGIDSNNFVARHLRKVMHSKRRLWVERHFSRHGNLTILAGRFMPMLRSLIFGMAGMSRISYLRFILLDGLAALVSVPLFIIVGYHFAYKIDWLFGKIDHIKHILIPCLVVIVAGGILFYYVRKNRLLREAANSPG